MAGKLRKLFTNKEIRKALIGRTLGEAAKELTKLNRGHVSSQMIRYWSQHLELTKKNGEPYLGTTVLDRNIRKDMKLSVPIEDKPNNHEDNNSVLVFGDTHAPYVHQDALAFLEALNNKYNFTRVIHLGDETDGHALSFHDSDPNLDSAGSELTKARKWLSKLERLFPNMELCHSNHGSLAYRKAKKAGIPLEMIKPYRAILFPNGQGKGWSWLEDIKIELPNGQFVVCRHETAGTPISNAAHEGCNYAQGHRHSNFAIDYRANSFRLYWSVTAGCLVDRKSLAFEYGKNLQNKPILGACVIINSLPVLVPMPLNEEGRWTGELEG